jgi:hypothetical protein
MSVVDNVTTQPTLLGILFKLPVFTTCFAVWVCALAELIFEGPEQPELYQQVNSSW